MKKKLLILTSIVTFFLFFVFIFFVFGQKKNEFNLLTKPYLKFEAETEIGGPLNLSTKKGIKGKLQVADLTEDRNYIFPDISGEVCLSAGNCLLSPLGIRNRLSKFVEGGLGNSSIEDLSKEISIFIGENGNVGIGLKPDFKLHVAGKIQARDDICTDLKGGICLSEVEKVSQQIEKIEKPTSLKEATIEGAGTPERVPLWKKNYQLGDSLIYQEGENIGIGMIPSYKLDVAGTVRMLGFRLPVSPKEGYGLISDDKGFGTWRPVLQPESVGGDIAERFLIDKNCQRDCPETGDLVVINEKGFIEKAKIPYDKRLIGVISSEPTLIMKSGLNEGNSLPVALIGKVLSKASLLNGEIDIGDPLTSSNLPGVAQKATQPGKIIGFALESLKENDFKECKKSEKILDCDQKIGKIKVLINLQMLSN